jgi:hypothetical protein
MSPAFSGGESITVTTGLFCQEVGKGAAFLSQKTAKDAMLEAKGQ